jgi:murein DD-endopeptidase MepM/ murein hydrolase activator NlpD
LPNATVGLQRVLARLRPSRLARAQSSVRFHRRTIEAAQGVRVRAASIAATAQVAPARAVRATAPVTRPIRARFGPEAVLPAVVAVIVALASVASWLPGVAARGAVGGTTAEGSAPRIAIGGAARSYGEGELTPIGGRGAPGDAASGSTGSALEPLQGPPMDYRRFDPDAAAAAREAELARQGQVAGPFLEDGTLLKPIAVSTRLADGKDLLESYKVRQGDSLTAIADRFGVSMMSLVWANGLKSKEIKVGQTLVVPPFNGVVYTVKEGDTLEGLARKYKVEADRIYEINGLEDRVLIAGQTLMLAGAKGEPLPTPRPPASNGGGGGSTVRPPTTYNGGAFAWPVVGGGNYVSQHYHAGHYGLDIAADYGSRVVAAAGGTVTFSGWKNNGGGYQVWIAHGSGLYTTYNHMSGVSVGVGQRVGRGQQVGRVGTSGWATGPHLHFEVWRGPIWSGGTRVNPLIYL